MQVKGLVSIVAASAVLSVLAITGSATGAVSTGHSAWEWGNPLPQGNDILAVEFAGNRGYAAGNFGTLLTSTDGGAGWAGVPTGITANLNRVRIIDGDSLVIAGGCSVRRSDDAGGSFTRLAWTANDANCPSTITSLSFPSENAGYLLAADGSVFQHPGRRRSRGLARQPSRGLPPQAGTSSLRTSRSPPMTPEWWSRPPARSTGPRMAARRGPSSRCTIARCSGLFFVDASNGYAVGAGSSVLKTIDGGVTWTVKSTGGSLALTSIRCATAMICLITTDTGRPAAAHSRRRGQLLLGHAVDRQDLRRQLCLGDARDRGRQLRRDRRVRRRRPDMDRDRRPDRRTFTRLRATSPDLAVAVGERGTLARTTDGGAHLGRARRLDRAGAGRRVVPDRDRRLRARLRRRRAAHRQRRHELADPRHRDHLSAAGAAGAQPEPRAAGRVRAACCARPTAARLRPGAGPRRPLGRAIVNADRAGGAVFAWGARALLWSRNGGKTWRKLKRPTRSALASVDFVTTRLGFALAADGRVWKTRNGGRSWRELTPTGTDDAIDLSFGGPRQGWLVLRSFAGEGGGHLLRTSDQGRTWRPQLVDDDLDRSRRDRVDRPVHGLPARRAELPALHDHRRRSGRSELAAAHARRSTASGARSAIKVRGKLSPAEGGEQVVVSMRRKGSKRWATRSSRSRRTGASPPPGGSSRTSYFVAQWSGDDDRAGAGSRQLTVNRR